MQDVVMVVLLCVSGSLIGRVRLDVILNTNCLSRRPAFDKCYDGSVVTEIDTSLGMRRIEIMCGNCGGHLGHVFEGEGFTSTNERHCVNSVSIRYDSGNIDALESNVI